MSDAVWLGVIGLAGLIVKEVFDARRGRLAAAKVEEVKNDLKTANNCADRKLDENLEVNKENLKVSKENQEMEEKIHRLVNSRMNTQLKVSAVALRRVAQLTGDPDDIAAAELAESMYRDHDAREKVAER